jgi:nucleoid-associated protein YgaU
MPRHGSEDIIENDKELYEEFFERRDVPKITHYRSPRWPPLTARVRKRFSTRRHTWKLGDKYYKIANQYYGDPKLWWAIAWYNEKPTEAHVKPGSVLFIPTPIGKVLSYFSFGSV